MATIKVKTSRNMQFGGFTPYGNLTTLRFGIRTNATGAVIDSTGAAAPAVGDKIVLGTLPNGMLVEDFQVIVSTALTTGVTGSLGFEYADGIDDARLPQDAAYFGTGLALGTAGRIRSASSRALIDFPKEVALVLTIAGAANAKAGQVDIVIHGERLGAE